MPESVWGTGTLFYGKRGFASDGSYVTTQFVAIFGVALVPMRSIRIISRRPGFCLDSGLPTIETEYRQVSREPLDVRQVAGVLGIEAAAVLFVFAYGHFMDRFSSISLSTAVLGAVAGLGILFSMPVVLRMRARRKTAPSSAPSAKP